MQFHDYSTIYQTFKNNPKIREALRYDGIDVSDAATFNKTFGNYLDLCSRNKTGKSIWEIDPVTMFLLRDELLWQQAGRPYYNLWPSIIPAMVKLDLERAISTHFKLPTDQLLVRFPVKDNPLSFVAEDGQQYCVRAVLTAEADISAKVLKELHEMGGRMYALPEAAQREGVGLLTAYIDIGEKNEAGVTAHTYRAFFKHESMTIDWSLQHLPHHNSIRDGVQIPDEVVNDILRILCTLCLFKDDPEIVEPIVLNKDERKWRETRDPALVAKAVRRGNQGWSVGARIETAPHLRASCLALYWTGKGRTVPRVRMRKGSIVHRKRMGEVPTGFLGIE